MTATHSKFQGLVSRVPVYDEHLDLFAYDLRFSHGFLVSAGAPVLVSNSDELMISASANIELDALVGTYPVFVTLSDFWQLIERTLDWPHSQIILNLNGEAEAGRGSEDIKALRKQGYRLSAGGDVIKLSDDSLISEICICAVSADLIEANDLAERLARLSRRSFRLLAKNIETAAQFAFFKAQGFDYFEGNYFLKPRLVDGTELPANRVAVLRLLSKLQNPGTSFAEIENIINSDVSLSYKLLSIINSAYYGMAGRVDSVKRALVLLGVQQIKNWAAMILFSAMDFRPKELLVIALVRARTCELIAAQLGYKETRGFYTAGMFSVLDAIMDVSMPQILEKLCLSDEINEALLYTTGAIGQVLAAVMAIDSAEVFFNRPELEPARVMQNYLDGISWARGVSQQLLAG